MTHAAFDKEHRLTTDKITKREEGKVTIEIALLLSLKAMFVGIYATLTAAVNALTEAIQARGSAPGTALAGRGTFKNDTSDYEAVSVSRHGLMAEEEKDGDRDMDREGNRDRNRDGEEDLVREGSSTDDDVTIILSPLSPIPAQHPSKIPSSVLYPDDGKVAYTFLNNTPTAHTDLERPQSLGHFFKAEGINVLSGDANLFCADGLTMVLKRCVLCCIIYCYHYRISHRT